MKKIYLFLLLMTLALGASSQCFVYEGFDAGQMPPQDWTIQGLEAQWSAANSSTAGGTMPEGKFTYVQQTTTTRLISPLMNLTGLTSVKLSFRHMYDDYTGAGPKLGVATRSHNGAWTTVWEINPTANVGPELKEVEITGGDVGQDEFQFCFYLNGNMYNVDYWYVDNILFYNPLETNAVLTSITTPKYFDQPVQVTGTVMNVGTQNINELSVAWKVDGGETNISAFTGLNIAPEEVYNFTSAFLLNPPIGAHELTVWIYSVNNGPDNFAGDDTLVKMVNKVCHTIPRMPIFEEFTSSTCAPCANFNTGFVPWCNDHDSTITLLKYQMSWPSPGDPYYTEEGGVRRTFYGVNAVPDLYCNGGNVPTSVPDVQTAFDAAITLPGLLDVATAYTIDNSHNITVNSTVLPYADFSNLLINIAVFEELTYNNVMTNGETQFEHVMMKMLPDADGTVANLTDRTPLTINETFDLSSTNIERWDDISVVVFLQDATSKEIYQSKYGVMDAQFSTEARLSGITVGGTAIAGFSPDTYTYDFTLPSGTAVVPTVTGIPIEPNETVIVIPATELPGATTIDVFAQDLSVKKTYTINMDWPVGNTEPKTNAISIYPNPTHGMVTISGVNGGIVSVVDSKGQIMYSNNNFTGNTLDLTSYAKGVYLVNISVPGKNPVHQRVVVY